MIDPLDELRRRIDACDGEIVRLINERLRVCEEVGRLKEARGMEVRVPSREEEVIARALEVSEGPCPPDVLEKVLRLLIDAAVALENDRPPSPPAE